MEGRERERERERRLFVVLTAFSMTKIIVDNNCFVI
jgi:hypothetical protein